MKLENLLDTMEIIQNEKQLTDKIFKAQLNDLKLYQKETEKRKDVIVSRLFPEKIINVIAKLAYSRYAERKNNAIKVKLTEGEFLMYWYGSSINIEINNKRSRLNMVENKFDEIFDWWSSETYRESYMVNRLELLNTENSILNNIENNITAIYEEIARRIEQDAAERRQNNINSLTKLNKQAVEPKTKKQTVVITIQIEE